MYSPHSDLHKMFYTPEYIVFRVEINGKEYLGRPNTLRIKHPFDPGDHQSAIFYTYSSVQSFMAGYIGDQIQVTSEEIRGIEAIDTVNPEPLNKILAACNDIYNINPKADIGIIRRNIVPLLVTLSTALQEYEQVHELSRYEGVYDDIEALILECAKCPADLSEGGRANFVRSLKEKISVDVSRLIELSAQTAVL